MEKSGKRDETALQGQDTGGRLAGEGRGEGPGPWLQAQLGGSDRTLGDAGPGVVAGKLDDVALHKWDGDWHNTARIAAISSVHSECLSGLSSLPSLA